jgi:hypothetical protein
MPTYVQCQAVRPGPWVGFQPDIPVGMNADLRRIGADEENFLDRSKVRMFVVEERGAEPDRHGGNAL